MESELLEMLSKEMNCNGDKLQQKKFLLEIRKIDSQ